MKTGADHIDSLHDGRTVYLDGQVIENQNVKEVRYSN